MVRSNYAKAKGWISGVLAALLVLSVGWVGRGLVYGGGLEGRVRRLEESLKDYVSMAAEFDRHRLKATEVIANYKVRMPLCEEDIRELRAEFKSLSERCEPRPSLR